MRNIERSKLLLIIASVGAAILVGVVILIAVLIPKEEPVKPAPKTEVEEQQASIDEYYSGENKDENSADIKNPENDPDAPPEGMYKNDFKDDYGYIKLSDHEAAKQNPEGTVYDNEWTMDKWSELNCDIANKYTVSDEVMKPLRVFLQDLAVAGTEMSPQITDNATFLLRKMENSRGQRIPGDAKAIALTNCNRLENKVY